MEHNMLILLVGRLGLEPRTKALKGLSCNCKILILLTVTWVRQLTNGLFLSLQSTEVATAISLHHASADRGGQAGVKPDLPPLPPRVEGFCAVIATLALLAISGGANAAEPFHVEFKPLKHDVLAAEVLYQLENVVDLQQTLRIAREPARFHEVGTLSAFCGPHPSASQVWVGSIVLGAAHYGVTQLLTNAGFDNAARVWTYVSLGYKTWDVSRNNRVGLGY